jgi:hypothetical protein
MEVNMMMHVSAGLWLHMNYENRQEGTLYASNWYGIYYSILEYTIAVELSPLF